MAFNTLGSMFGMDEITSDGLVKIFLAGLVLVLLTWAGAYFAMKSLSDQLSKKKLK
ncbi:hypothetical protein V8V91_11200 [Algoriphagus halophilus]|uniref:hypothetical protein n=1 Tax=Algoriphagus halophilus TaxID=226505 RepID=UPI00358E7470